MATFELYRRSTIGMCLTETLDEMVSNGTLSPELAIQVLVQFDKSMTEALETQVKSKVTIKMRWLTSLRFCSPTNFYIAVWEIGCVWRSTQMVILLSCFFERTTSREALQRLFLNPKKTSSQLFGGVH
ncbi:transcription initiation factor IIA subunit 2 isoform X1 [Magnolia sinica]|uniref:transcription initiation factor IIA subunit 2 isoform X1 n=1 Tax=Magnolia sinica TaxID=86752 RepID=UPI002658E216|nr:transcription initiation factor IIA subunit 2 isoform X1 [Magnolia sinica]XP_058084152.1 transcription initiation factor IIA subunit 2 isoform X1 [Magnolia sinica]